MMTNDKPACRQALDAFVLAGNALVAYEPPSDPEARAIHREES